MTRRRNARADERTRRRVVAAGSTFAASLALVVAACTPPGTGRLPTPAVASPAAPPAVASAPASPAASPATLSPSPTPAVSPDVSGLFSAPTTSDLTPAATAGISRRVSLGLEKVAGGFAAPLFVTGDGTGSGRLYVVEQGGRIRLIEPGGRVASRPFLDISERITSGGERGLLGLAFHPSYASNGLFYVDYTDRDGNTVVSEMRRSADSPDRADATSQRVLLHIDQPYPNHNGGMLAFGLDGFLYVGMGDGGSSGDPQNRAQSLGTLLGKILRIDVDERDGGLPYAVPPTNPFVDRPGARPEIWASGVRNPWRFSFDATTGDLWVGDVGQDRWEEVDRLTATTGGGRGTDLGWRLMEGRACYDPTTGCPTAGLTMPMAVYGHDVGCAITGGYVYRGSRSPALDGTYLFSDYCSGRIWGLDAAGPDVQDPVLLLESGGSIASFGQGDDRELYVADIAQGSIFRVVATAR